MVLEVWVRGGQKKEGVDAAGCSRFLTGHSEAIQAALGLAEGVLMLGDGDFSPENLALWGALGGGHDGSRAGAG